MRILLAAATEAEIAPLVSELGDGLKSGSSQVGSYTYAEHDIQILITGVGMVAMAVWCSRELMQNHYDLALNTGTCGACDPVLTLGQVVHVIQDRIVELGAEDDEDFITIQELKLLAENEFPYKQGWLMNHCPPASGALAKLAAVSGITVNTVHGNKRSITSVRRRFQPQVESMEGAAFMYACMIHGIPFAEVRAVSNVVEKRNREAWRMSEAILNLSEAALKILKEV